MISHFSKVFERILSFFPKNYYCREGYVHFTYWLNNFEFEIKRSSQLRTLLKRVVENRT